jgi:hypothetical protein
VVDMFIYLSLLPSKYGGNDRRDCESDMYVEKEKLNWMKKN